MYLQQNCKMHKIATKSNNFKKLIILDMHYRATYIFINFQQNRISRSVKNANTKLFANNRKLHKFVTCNSNFETKLLSDMHNPDVDI